MSWENNDGVLVYQLIVKMVDRHCDISSEGHTLISKYNCKCFDKFVDHIKIYTRNFIGLEVKDLEYKLEKSNLLLN